jgi:hypothetical protein
VRAGGARAARGRRASAARRGALWLADGAEERGAQLALLLQLRGELLAAGGELREAVGLGGEEDEADLGRDE